MTVPPSIPEIDYGQIRALIVEDRAFSLSILARVLRTIGLKEIIEAVDGRQAIEILDKSARSIDVVFCDLMMPNIDGIEVVRHAATLPWSPAFLFVSGGGADLLRIAADTARKRGLRVVGAIEKPPSPKAIRLALAKLDPKPSHGPDPHTFKMTASDIAAALEKDQFVLHFQPKISLPDDAVVGFESLIRWMHPQEGMVLPGAFVGAAEQTGQIEQLTDRVMMLAVRQAAAWAGIGLRLGISVNLSAFTLTDLKLPDHLARETATHAISPQQITLEITEAGLVQDRADALEILARLHMKGFPLSIDDFGHGYSSMELLRRFPFAEMKIDRSFVRGAGEDIRARAFLASSVEMGKSLKLTVVAEGVETQQDRDTARQVGVDIAQGYFFAKPMDASRVPAWLESWASRRST